MEGGWCNAKQKPKAAWEAVCREKAEGGLGVLNIKTQNEALLIKHLHKFFNRVIIPWVSFVWKKYYSSGKLLPGSAKKGSFWWKDIIKLLDKFKGMARVQIRNGRSCFLWEDLWVTEILSKKFPELFSFAKNKHIVFADGRPKPPSIASFTCLCQSRHMPRWLCSKTFWVS